MAFDLWGGKQTTRDWGCNVSAMGNILTPTSILNKIDDVRYDLRNIGANVTSGVFALAGAFAFLAFAKVYKAAGRVSERKAA